MASYKQTREDFEYLERIVELTDQVELDAERLYLMQDPTKKRAAMMYESGIDLWFREHGKNHNDLRVDEIAERYGIFL